MQRRIVMRETGQISIHTENIFPIIKKWLYSEKEIFLRELVANASDAISKLHKISLSEDIQKDLPEPAITITLDKKAGTLTIADTGLGMTEDEVKRYINQVAFSSVHDFVKKYHDKGDKEQIIGHFGLGFYSSFMVAKKVEIETLSYQNDAEAVHWECEDGSTEFVLTRSKKTSVGTTITLHISDDAKEMLESAEILKILQRYCYFIRYPITFDDKVINEPIPLYTKSASQLTDKDYLDFFHTLFPVSADPLFWIHINVDYPFKLKGILYFPKLKHELDASEGKVKLFCNQVFVSDNCQELIPEFLTLLKGVIDCPDLPLNVSRSYLQNDPQAKKIATHIIKKVADKLTGMFKTEREQFEKYWDDIHPFVKYGMLRDEAFYDRLLESIFYKSNSGKYYTLNEYITEFGEKSGGKIYYASDLNSQIGYIKLFENEGIPVLQANTVIDGHFMSYVEMKSAQKYKFSRVDSGLSDNLVNKDGQSKIVDPKDQKNQSEKIAEIFQKHLAVTGIKVKVESLKASTVPGLIIMDESQRRMEEMLKLNTQGGFSGGLGLKDRTLLVNQNSPAVKNLLVLYESGSSKENDVKLVVNQVYDLACLQHGGFDSAMMQDFLARSSEILERVGHSSQGASSIIL